MLKIDTVTQISMKVMNAHREDYSDICFKLPERNVPGYETAENLLFKQFGRPSMSNILQELLEDAAHDEKDDDFDEGQVEPEVAPEINAEPENLEGKTFVCFLFFFNFRVFKKSKLQLEFGVPF